MLSDIIDRAHLLTFHFKKVQVKGTFAGFDPSGETLKFVLDRKYEWGLTEAFQADYIHKKIYFSFDSNVTNVLGSTIYVKFPALLIQHVNRESKRLDVLDKEIPIRIHFLGANAKKKSDKADTRIERSEFAQLYLLLQEDVPDMAKIGKICEMVLRGIGDKVEFRLGKMDKTFFPAQQTMKELKKTFYMPDSNKGDAFMARSVQYPLVGQFIDFLEHQHKIKKAEVNAVQFWMEEYRRRKISSEVFAPVMVLDSAIGYLYAGTTPQTKHRITYNQVAVVMALADALAEAVIKRNINSKSVKAGDVYRVKLADISEGGMRFLVTDPILLKIISFASELEVDINFFDKWIKTYGEVLRVLPGEREGIEGNFSFRFMMDQVSSNDRIYLKRIISYYETGKA
jgi:hypothetical protein